MLNPLQRRRAQAYQRLFAVGENGPVGDAHSVLADIKRFARLPDAPVVKDATGRVDPIASAIMVGRQEMANRILFLAQVDDPTLFNLTETKLDD